MAIITELKVEFDDGLNIITGETGTGKSLIIKAIQFLLGKRFSPELLRTGSNTLIIEGEFEKVNIPTKDFHLYNIKRFPTR